MRSGRRASGNSSRAPGFLLAPCIVANWSLFESLSSTMNALSHCGAAGTHDGKSQLRTWPFSSAGTLAAVAIVAETGDATLGDHLNLHRMRSLGTPRNAHSSCHLT